MDTCDIIYLFIFKISCDIDVFTMPLSSEFLSARQNMVWQARKRKTKVLYYFISALMQNDAHIQTLSCKRDTELPSPKARPQRLRADASS